MAEYEAPDILSTMDDDEIHQEMLSNLPSDIDKTAGGFAHDFTRPAALEKSEMMLQLNEVIQLFFPEWSYGVYLDNIAFEVGLTRKSPTASTTELTIVGEEGTVIPQGFIFSTASTAGEANVEFEVTEETVIGSGGSATVPVQCTETGVVGNVPANSITLMSTPMTGIETVTNPSAATGGTEEEDDEDLRERIKERDQQGESSFVGNNADYKRWAQEVDGVGDVMVIPEWQGAGTGTVKLIVMDANAQPASATILTNVYNHIMSPSDPEERLAPIGAILTVVTATLLSLTITATVDLDEDTSIAEATASFESKLADYFSQVKEQAAQTVTGIGTIRYTRIAGLLTESVGVLDYSNLLINGAAANVSVPADEYPSADTVTLTESGA